MEIESVSQPAFAWAVGPWRDSRSVRLQAADFRAGGYYVRIVPDDSVSAFRLAVGHYQSEEEARRDEVALPLTVRSTAEIIPVERHVVFTDPLRVPERGVGKDSTDTAGTASEASGDKRTRQRSSRDQLQRSWAMPGTMLRPFELRLSTSMSYDSNIGHDQDDLIASVGFVPGLMLRYRSTLRNPIVLISYGVSRHQYSQTEKWDRVSQMGSLSIRPPLHGVFRMKTDFNLASNGSFEDRDVSDQIRVVQEFEYRITSDVRFHTYGTLRWKYPKDNDDDAFKPNVGVVLEQKLDGDRTWEMGARYEVNLEEVERGNYSRWTFEMEYEVPLSDRSEIDLGVKHRLKNYWEKDVEIEDEDYLRRDQRWILGGVLDYELSSNVTARLGYQFEARTSNDPEKPFKAHLFDFGLVVMM